MLLTLEGRYLNYSLGENINLDKLEDIADIAVRHGFEVFKPEPLT
jgi:predicted amino acid dehydrogenase